MVDLGFSEGGFVTVLRTKLSRNFCDHAHFPLNHVHFQSFWRKTSCSTSQSLNRSVKQLQNSMLDSGPKNPVTQQPIALRYLFINQHQPFMDSCDLACSDLFCHCILYGVEDNDEHLPHFQYRWSHKKDSRISVLSLSDVMAKHLGRVLGSWRAVCFF